MMFADPDMYSAGKVASGLYLLYVGAQMARTDVHSLLQVPGLNHAEAPAASLVSRGFFAAVSNPKSWLFYASLLPPLIHPERSLLPQVAALISLLLTVEFMALLLYATCGQAASAMLKKAAWARLFFVSAGAIIAGFGCQIILER